MKIITIYETFDGTHFYDLEEAEEHELALSEKDAVVDTTSIKDFVSSLSPGMQKEFMKLYGRQTRGRA